MDHVCCERDACLEPAPAERRSDRRRQISAGLVRLQESKAKLAMRLGDRSKGRRLLEQPVLAGGFGFAPGAADQLAESLDRQIGQGGLALDHEGDQRGVAALDRQPPQLPRVKNFGFSGDDAVAIGMDRLATIVGNADLTQYAEPSDHALEVLQPHPFGRVCDPTEDGAVIGGLGTPGLRKTP